MQIAAFSGSLHADKEGLPCLQSCACVSFLCLLTHTGWFWDEAFMYSNCSMVRLDLYLRLLASLKTEVAIDLT